MVLPSGVDGQKVVIDQILNYHYEALQKIENDAVNLMYMTEDVAKKLDDAWKEETPGQMQRSSLY